MYVYIWLCAALVALWLYLRQTYSYFRERGVSHLPPLPLLGNMARVIFKMDHLVDGLNRLYFAFPDDRFVGNYEFLAPTVMIRDPELIRLITIKDFDYFIDHRRFFNKNDPLIAKGLFGLQGEEWRDMRAALSPSFTCSKLRGMVPLIQDCSKNLVEYLYAEIKKVGYMDVDSKELFTRYANDVIASCAFGFRINSIADRDDYFYNMGCALMTFELHQVFKIFLVLMFPKISKHCDISVFPKQFSNFLRSIVLNAIKKRDEKNIYRSDLIQILMHVKKGCLKHELLIDERKPEFLHIEESTTDKKAKKRVWDDEHLLAQALVFLFAGFDTMSTTMMFIVYELAVNPAVQAKLREEIDSCFDRCSGKIDYDRINRMQYMDMVLSETLRKWPPGATTDRNCEKRYNVGKPNEKATKDFYLEKGSVVIIPISSIHHDPKYYPDPHRFNPERFSDDNKHNIKPFTYLPFGVGPRRCIGSRFALIEVKVMLFDLLRHFELSPAPKTRVPVRLDPAQFMMRFLGGHWIRITLRHNK